MGADPVDRARRMIARYGRPAVGLLAVLAVIAAWNVLRYPPGLGYDAAEHIAYAQGILDGKGFPDGVGEYYTPPGFYTVAAGAIWLGQKVGLGEPLRVVQLVNAALLLATAVLLLELARLVFPGRRRLHLAALGLFVFGVLAPRSAAMVHPETMSMFFSTLALVLAARMIVRRAWSVLDAVALGAALGAAQLVRAFSLWTFAVVMLVLVTVAIVRVGERRRVVVAVLVTLLATGRRRRAVVRLPVVPLHGPDLRSAPGASPPLEASAGLVLRRSPAARGLQLADARAPREPLRARALRRRVGGLLRRLRLAQP